MEISKANINQIIYDYNIGIENNDYRISKKFKNKLLILMCVLNINNYNDMLTQSDDYRKTVTFIHNNKIIIRNNIPVVAMHHTKFKDVLVFEKNIVSSQILKSICVDIEHKHNIDMSKLSHDLMIDVFSSLYKDDSIFRQLYDNKIVTMKIKGSNILFDIIKDKLKQISVKNNNSSESTLAKYLINQYMQYKDLDIIILIDPNIDDDKFDKIHTYIVNAIEKRVCTYIDEFMLTDTYKKMHSDVHDDLHDDSFNMHGMAYLQFDMLKHIKYKLLMHNSNNRIINQVIYRNSKIQDSEYNYDLIKIGLLFNVYYYEFSQRFPLTLLDITVPFDKKYISDYIKLH